MKWVKIAWQVIAILRELIKMYKSLEKRFGWGKNRGPEVKKAIRDKKRAALDRTIFEVFNKAGLPEPDRNMQAYIREAIHGALDDKQKKKGKTAGRKKAKPIRRVYDG